MATQNKKRNITLSVDAEVARKAKSSLALSGKTMSGVLEDALEGQITEFKINALASALGIKIERISKGEVKKKRPKAPPGFDSTSIIREMRSRL